MYFYQLKYLCYFHKYDMGCNCNKDNIPLRKRIRQKTKEKIAEIKRIWNETSTNGTTTITTNKNELGFK